MEWIPTPWGGIFGMRPREAWANWILCVCLQYIHHSDITYKEDGGDWTIVDKKSGEEFRTEHISALENTNWTKLPMGNDRIIWAINKKIEKGVDYAQWKILVVFFDGAGTFYPSKVRNQIKGKHNFLHIFWIGLLKTNNTNYEYSVTNLNIPNPITYMVSINHDFSNWDVSPIGF